jgi:2-polyprenyl-3-methyl-5-hydroxy-6-metoxy-1,4-benzoquinol methylase
MSRIVNKIAKFAIGKAKKSKLIQSLFEAPIDVNSLSKKGEFIDSLGTKHVLYNELRSKIKPGWEGIYKQTTANFNSSPEYIENVSRNGKIALERITPIINTFSTGIKDKSVLEIGCHYGGLTFALAENEAAKITGTDYSGYKASAVDRSHDAEKPSENIDAQLTEIRQKVSKLYNYKNKVNFYDDDITNSKLPSSEYDLILSFDVLEHINNPQKAFETIHQILKPGGIAIHEYNPFFSLNGGHSACTMDFLWGHTRLSDADFSRYLKEIRPAEFEKSISFYAEGLNRMCLSDLEKFSNVAGLKIVSLFQITKEQHIRMMSEQIYKETKANYPNITVSDLVAPKIIVVQQKIM